MRALVYLSGPYSGKNYNEIERNILTAEYFADLLWAKGFGVFCPHSNTRHMELRVPSVTYEQYMNADSMLLNACDAVLMLPDWRNSKGATVERSWAVTRGIPVYESLEDLIKDYEDGA